MSVKTKTKPEVKLEEIQMVALYRDEHGSISSVRRVALSFESAEEDLGKLERFIDRKRRETFLRIEDEDYE